MQTRARAVVLMLMLALVSCGAVGPKFERSSLTDPQYGYVYVFRPGSTAAGGMRTVPNVYIDGTKVAALRDGGYVVSKLKAGEHVVELEVSGATRRVRRTIDVRGMDEFFFRLAVDTTAVKYPFYTVSTEMLRVKPDHAMDEIVNAKRAADMAIFDRTTNSPQQSSSP